MILRVMYKNYDVCDYEVEWVGDSSPKIGYKDSCLLYLSKGEKDKNSKKLIILDDILGFEVFS